jgi:pyruvate-ferredoxin/flavodoxin oxidoreductase
MTVVGGRYGLSSKDTTPAQIIAVFDNLEASQPKNHFTVGIIDDVYHTSLPVKEEVSILPKSIVSCKFWGLGSDGTVGANRTPPRSSGRPGYVHPAYFVSILKNPAA